jgi:hypothetical protein
MATFPKLFSKSLLMRGLQCAKNFYFTLHHPEWAAPVSEAQQTLFDQGTAVGCRAREEFPDGVLISAKASDTALAVHETQEAIRQGALTLFEAAFTAAGLSARVDILHKSAKHSPWQLIEVKSSTSVKEEHLEDVALQLFIAEAAEISIESASIWHLNNRSEAPKLDKLFISVDVTQSALEKKAALSKKLAHLKEIAQQATAPAVSIGLSFSNESKMFSISLL